MGQAHPDGRVASDALVASNTEGLRRAVLAAVWETARREGWDLGDLVGRLAARTGWPPEVADKALRDTGLWTLETVAGLLAGLDLRFEALTIRRADEAPR